MCNYYKNEIRKAGRERDYYGFDEFSETPQDIYPDRLAPVIRRGPDGRPLWAAMRWGFPPPKEGLRPVINARNLESPYWRTWLEPEWRCLVPFTRFAEYDDHSPKGRKVLRWFALPGEPMAFFAGVWRPWTGDRGPKSAPESGRHLLFAFLTCEPNAVVAPVHAKAMPVVLGSPEDQDAWLDAPAETARMLARPFPEARLAMVA